MLVMHFGTDTDLYQISACTKYWWLARVHCHEHFTKIITSIYIELTFTTGTHTGYSNATLHNLLRVGVIWRVEDKIKRYDEWDCWYLVGIINPLTISSTEGLIPQWVIEWSGEIEEITNLHHVFNSLAVTTINNHHKRCGGATDCRLHCACKLHNISEKCLRGNFY